MPVARLAPLQSVVRQLRLTWQSRIQGHPTSDARVDQHLMQRRENGDRDGDLAILLLEAIHSLRAAKLPLDRVSLALVPEQSGFNGVQYQWLVDDPDEVHSFLRLNEFFFGEDHRTSILHHICYTGRPEQLKLQELSLDQISFPLLRDLRRDHFSDYVALPLPAGPTHRVVLTLASRTPAAAGRTVPDAPAAAPLPPAPVRRPLEGVDVPRASVSG
jgi:hypothetical protein